MWQSIWTDLDDVAKRAKGNACLDGVAKVEEVTGSHKAVPTIVAWACAPDQRQHLEIMLTSATMCM